jgi:nitroreductase
MEKFLDLAQKRRSVRAYSDQEVTKEQLLTLVEAGQAAPSAGNCQPWHFYVVKSSKLQEKVTDSCNQSWVQTAPASIIVCIESERSEMRYKERGRTLYAIQDTAAAVQNILLAAENMGLGSCWIGAFDENQLSASLEIPESLRPVAVLPVGYPETPVTVPQRRRPVDEIVTVLEC